MSPNPVSTLTTPSRHAGFGDDLGEQQRGERCLLGGLEDHGVAARERGRDLERGHHQREVPRDDLRAHPDRLAQREGVEPAARRPRHRHRDGAALDLGGPAGVVQEDLRRPRDVDGACDRHRLAVVEGLQLGELVGAGEDALPDRHSMRCRSAGVSDAPRTLVECPPRRLDGRSTSSTPLCGTVVMHRFGGGIDGLEPAAGERIDPLPVDVHLPRARHEVDDSRVQI